MQICHLWGESAGPLGITSTDDGSFPTDIKAPMQLSKLTYLVGVNHVKYLLLILTANCSGYSCSFVNWLLWRTVHILWPVTIVDSCVKYSASTTSLLNRIQWSITLIEYGTINYISDKFTNICTCWTPYIWKLFLCCMFCCTYDIYNEKKI